MKDGRELGAISRRPRPEIPRDLQSKSFLFQGSKGLTWGTERHRWMHRRQQWGCSRGGVGGEDCQRAVWRRKMEKLKFKYKKGIYK